MRRGVIALCALALSCPIPTAHASGEVTAGFYGVVQPSDDYSTVSTVLVCEARATRATSSTSVTCSIDDGASGPGVSMTCDSPGPEAVCPVQLLNGTFDVTVCSYATAILADHTTDTDTLCRTYTPPTS